MSELNDYQSELDKLRQEEDLLREKIKEIELKKANLSKFKPILVSDFILYPEAGTFSFKLSDYRYDVVEAIKSLRTWNSYNKTNTAQVANYDTIINSIKLLPNITIEYNDPEFINNLRSWTPLADIEISCDSINYHFKYNGYKSSYIPQYIRGSRHISSEKMWKIPISRSIELWNKISELSGYTVKWSKEALEICEKAVNRNKVLDEIAKKEIPNISEDLMNLNGHRLKNYQGITLEFAIEADGRMLIQHQMGLGKTPCALAYGEYLRKKLLEVNKKFMCIIFAPAQAKPNWVAQVKKFTDQLPFKLSGSTPTNLDVKSLLNREYNYFLINYDPISDSFVDFINTTVDNNGIKHETQQRGSAWIKLFNLVNPDLIIIDEAHYLKNATSKRTQAMLDLETDNKGVLLLTGTSITNRPNDLHSLLYLIDKDIAGSRESFVNRYFDRDHGVRNAIELKEILKPIAFRKTTLEVLKELEPIRRIVKEYELSDSANKRYQLVLQGLFESVDKWDGNPKNSQLITNMLTMLLRCKQVVAEDKIPFTIDLAKEIIEENDENDKYNKCIIFSQFVNSPDVVRQIANELEGSILITGDDTPEKRFSLVQEFQEDPSKKYLVCSIMAASESLDITAAGHVIFHDFMWNPAIHAQAEGRAYGRLNDPHSIDSYYIKTVGTIEEQIWSLLERKLRIFKEVIEDAEVERDPTIAIGVLEMIKEMRRMS